MSAFPAQENALPSQIAAWLGKVAVVEAEGITAERGLIEAFAVAVEDANPLFWDDARAAEIAGGVIAPPAMLSTWTRPHGWSPAGPPKQRPLELHFRLKELFALPKAVVIETEAAWHEPVRPGDRVRAEQILDQVGPLVENRLGRGRKWTIGIRYARMDGVLLGVETLRFFAYGGEGAKVPSTVAEQPSPPPSLPPPPKAALSMLAASGRGGGTRSEALPLDGGGLGGGDATRLAGIAIPSLTIQMTATRIVMGAAASRDWQPQHHDPRHAKAAGLPDIILNAPSQSGWLGRTLTDWAGPEARIGRMRFRMVKPIAAGDTIIIQGLVEAAADSTQGWRWLRLALKITVGDELATDAASLLAIPLTECPWRADSHAWHIPEWDLSGRDMQEVFG